MSEYVGHENLETAIQRKNFTKWVYEVIFSGLKGDILEVGSGLGTFSEHVIRDFPDSAITLSDISSSYIQNLKERFSGKNVTVYKLDLNVQEDYENIGYEKFDSIIAINVLEHVKNDELALQQLYKMLRKNGTLIILVPANKFLYNVIDKSIDHWRRYTKKELETKIKNTKFSVEKMFSFNMLGVVGWYVNGTLCKKVIINKKASKVFDRLVPAMKIVEKILQRKIGLSIICYAKK
ncbi:MAG: class I SAM-dependent methyltransferase [Nitrosopumilaceae archaeon]